MIDSFELDLRQAGKLVARMWVRKKRLNLE
jgi:hypothetical protein